MEYVINGMGVYGRHLFTTLVQNGDTCYIIDGNLSASELAFLLNGVDEGYRIGTVTYTETTITVDGGSYTLYPSVSAAELLLNKSPCFIDCTGSGKKDDATYAINNGAKWCFIINFGTNGEGPIFTPYSTFAQGSPKSSRIEYMMPADLSACMKIAECLPTFDNIYFTVVSGSSNNQFVQDSKSNLSSYPQLGQSAFGLILDTRGQLTKMFGRGDHPEWNGKICACRVYVPTQRGMMINVNALMKEDVTAAGFLKSHFADTVASDTCYTEQEIVSSDCLLAPGTISGIIVPNSLVVNGKHISFTVFYDNVAGYFEAVREFIEANCT